MSEQGSSIKVPGILLSLIGLAIIQIIALAAQWGTSQAEIAGLKETNIALEARLERSEQRTLDRLDRIEDKLDNLP